MDMVAQGLREVHPSGGMLLNQFSELLAKSVMFHNSFLRIGSQSVQAETFPAFFPP